MYKLTEEGKQKCERYILEMKAKRKEILDARIDTADDTQIPDCEDIESEIQYFVGEDENGKLEYYNNWGVTDNYNTDYPLTLKINEDFVPYTSFYERYMELFKTIEDRMQSTKTIEHSLVDEINYITEVVKEYDKYDWDDEYIEREE